MFHMRTTCRKQYALKIEEVIQNHIHYMFFHSVAKMLHLKIIQINQRFVGKLVLCISHIIINYENNAINQFRISLYLWQL